MSEIVYKQLEWNEDKKKFKVLHNILFKNTAMSAEWLDWYFELAKDVRVYGAFDKEDLIGIWCVESKCLQIDRGSTRNVGRCFSVGVHPGFQRRGIFLALSKFAIKQEKKKGQHDYILGFPQFGRSVIDGHLKAGWEFVQDIDMCSIKPNLVDENASIRSIGKLEHFDDEDLVSSKGSFKESAKYYTRRWLRHPDNHYIIFDYEPGSFIVVKPYGDSCHILELEGPDEDIVYLLEAVKTLAKRHAWKEVNLWCAENDPKKNTVKSCGYSLGSERGTGVKLLAVRINAIEPLVLDKCSFQMGVEEPY